jgi:hypothetical protein
LVYAQKHFAKCNCCHTSDSYFAKQLIQFIPIEIQSQLRGWFDIEFEILHFSPRPRFKSWTKESAYVNGYKFYFKVDVYMLIQSFLFHRKQNDVLLRNAKFNNDELDDYLSKCVIHLPMDNLTDLIGQSKGKILKRILKDPSTTQFKGMVFPLNHRFLEIFEHQIKRFLTAGILNIERNDLYEKVNPKRFLHMTVDEVQPMNLEHLEAAFVVWLISMIFPVVAFIVEWIIMLVLRLKDFIVFKYVFEIYIKSLEENSRIRNIKMQETYLEIKKKSLFKKYAIKVIKQNQEKKRKTYKDQVGPSISQDIIETLYDEIINYQG